MNSQSKNYRTKPYPEVEDFTEEMFYVIVEGDREEEE